MKYIFTSPRHTGDWLSPIIIDHLEVCGVAFNFEPERASKGTENVSIMLCHAPTGWKHNIMLEGAAARELWAIADNSLGLTRAVLDHLVSKVKLPDGTISG